MKEHAQSITQKDVSVKFPEVNKKKSQAGGSVALSWLCSVALP